MPSRSPKTKFRFGVFEVDPASGDSRWIVYDTASDDAGWEIRLIEAGGGQPRAVASDPALDRVPSFSHDGQWIYFGSNRSGRDEVYRVRVAGGEAERQVLESVCGRDFESTERGVYYIGGTMDDLRLGSRGGGGQEIVVKLLEETGRSREVARSGRPLYLAIGMSVSRDDKTIFFSATADAGADLMLVENFR